jgi:hypothetical protein
VKRQHLVYLAFLIASLAVVLAVPWYVQRQQVKAQSTWAGLVNPGPLSAAHQMLEGKCASCHTPVKGVESKNCLTCHAGNDFADQQSARFHAIATECSSCHIEHDGGKSIVKMDHDLLTKHRLWASRAGRNPAHPQSSDPLKALNCASCHSNRDPHGGLFGSTCSTCHSTERWTVGDFRHPVPTNRECSQCHKPPPSHLMEHFEMVSQAHAQKRARVDQCYACHMTDSWNNIRGKGMYDHH